MDPAFGRTFERLSQIPGLQAARDVSLAAHTRFGIGGPADLFVETAEEEAFLRALGIAKESGLSHVIIGAGSNLIVADAGYRGMVLKFSGGWIEELPDYRLRVQAGAMLQAVVDFTTARGLQGLETMTGIPGFIGAAIYGNAGAFGHSMHERVVSARYFDGAETKELENAAIQSHYRDSIFKRHKDWIILSAVLQMLPGDATALQSTSARILEIRNKKYPPTMKCAGSIFKNYLFQELPEAVQAEVPREVIIEGKVPSAWFLDQVGAKGTRRGEIQVADYHANLIYNAGSGTAEDLRAVIQDLKARVTGGWGIPLEEEVQYVGFD